MGIDPVSLAITVALNAAMMGLNAMRTIEGPRLSDLTATVADYGTPYNYFHGTRRFEVPCVYAEPIKEKKKKKKTKGGKYNEYTYFGTWASMIADHEIDAVLRVWFDRHLIFDGAANGPRAAANPAEMDLGEFLDQRDRDKNGFASLAQHARIYLGTEDQLPDPRMQAKIEADDGDGMCPALRGRAYIFFEDMPLEKFGNRFPQVTVEATRNSTVSFPMEQKPFGGLRHSAFSPDLNRLYTVHLETLQIWDAQTRTIMFQTPLAPNGVDWNATHLAITSDGRIWHTSGFDWLVMRDPQGQNAQLVMATDGGSGNISWFIDGNGIEYIGLSGRFGGGNAIKWINTLTLVASEFDLDPGTFGRGPAVYFYDAYGDCWCVCAATGGPSFETVFVRIVTVSNRFPAQNTFSYDIGIVGVDGACHVASANHYFLSTGAGYVFIDDATMAIKEIKPHMGAGAAVRPDQNSFWTAPAGDRVREISVVTGEIIQDYDLYDWPTTDPHGFASSGTREEFYDPVNHAWVSWYSPDALVSQYRITWRFLERTAGSGVTLRTIIEDVADQVGLPASNLDASACDQSVKGYSWTQGSAKQIIEPLLELYDVDARPHNFKIEFLPRGGASLGSLSHAYFARSGEEDPYRITVVGDTDLPHRIFLNFADIEHDQQVNSAVARRSPEAMDSVRELTIDLSTWAADSSEAQQLVERLLRRRWFSREKLEFNLSAMQIALEPADLFTFDMHGIVMTARLLTNRIKASGILETVWERDIAGLTVTSNSEGAPMLGRPPSVLLMPALTQAFILDVPLLSETDEFASPFMYTAGGPFGQSVFWPGASIWRAEVDGGDFEPEWQSFTTLDKASWGFCQEALGDAVADVLDIANSLNVRFMHGTPTSVTLQELLDDWTLNRAVVGSHENGWEIIQYQTATLEADASYTLSGFVRGVQGTEMAMATHAVAELIILVGSEIKRRSMPTSEIGDTDYYQAHTAGRDDAATTYAVEYTAAHLRPLSPSHLALVRNTGTGDWTISAKRRTRLGGNLIDGQDVPLGETSESYKIEILDYDIVLATKTTAALPYAYTAAAQVVDFGSAQTHLSVRLMQISPALSLDGYPAEAEA